MKGDLLIDAVKVSDALKKLADGRQPHEIMKLDAQTMAIVCDVEGVDYILTMMRVPKQRPRPTEQ